MTAHTAMGLELAGLDLAVIDAGDRLRKVLPARVEALAEDLDERGLLTPVEVVGPLEAGGYRLIYGAHRLAAAQRLGWTEILAVIHAPDAFAGEAETRLREIRENLMRFELNPLERAVAIAAWRDIYEAANGKVKRGRTKKSQDATISSDTPELEAAERFSASFKEAAQQALGLHKDAVYRALKIATISPEIRDRIADSPLAGNQSELLKLADQSPERQAQIVGLLLAEPAAAATVDDAIAILDKTPPAPAPKPWEQLCDRFARLKLADQRRFFAAHRDAIEAWLSEES